MSIVLTDQQAIEYIAANLRSRLDALGMTQTRLAELTGSTKMRISHYIHGARMPSAAVLARIADALDTTADQLLSKPSKKSRQKV